MVAIDFLFLFLTPPLSPPPPCCPHDPTQDTGDTGRERVARRDQSAGLQEQLPQLASPEPAHGHEGSGPRGHQSPRGEAVPDRTEGLGSKGTLGTQPFVRLCWIRGSPLYSANPPLK